MRRVLKVGSHVLAGKEGIAHERIKALVALIVAMKHRGDEVMLVSSGAVAAGHSMLPIDRSDIARRQALAAVGQPLLMKMYQEAFGHYGMLCSQVLLGADVFDSRRGTRHARGAIEMLLEHGVVPIINENDTVSIEELVFGDNDRLSAYVTHYFDADMLVILSDIDGYYTADPRTHAEATLRRIVTHLEASELNAKHSPGEDFATGGIVTKLQAADFLMKYGRKMLLASGFDLEDARAFLLEGTHRGGTLFVAKGA